MAAITQVPDEHGGSDKNLTLLEHLQELRNRLMICTIALVLGMVASFYKVTNWTLEWMQEPARDRVENFHLIFTQPLEYWTTYFQVSLLIGLTLAMPIIVWQLLAFVGPGLTRNEKRWAYPLVGGISFMFVLGCLFAYYVELPPALNFLLDTGNSDIEPFISVQKYVGFVTKMLLVNGLAFQTPMVVMGLAKIGIVTSRKLLGWWRFAIVGAFIISAIITPSIDPVTQTLVAGPMVFLYFFGIALAKLVEGKPIIPRQ
ncbi:MAG: twin-arginine translocase subunit TatC [Dehalococcoidia bacterium]